MVTTGAIRRAKLQSNRHHQQTNTQFFYRPYALPVTQPTVSEHWRNDFHHLFLILVLPETVHWAVHTLHSRLSIVVWQISSLAQIKSRIETFWYQRPWVVRENGCWTSFIVQNKTGDGWLVFNSTFSTNRLYHVGLFQIVFCRLGAGKHPTINRK